MESRPEIDMKMFGRILKELRLMRGYTVEQVREYLMLGSVQAVYKYESGKSFPPLDTFFALMNLYESNIIFDGDKIKCYLKTGNREYVVEPVVDNIFNTDVSVMNKYNIVNKEENILNIAEHREQTQNRLKAYAERINKQRAS